MSRVIGITLLVVGAIILERLSWYEIIPVVTPVNFLLICLLSYAWGWRAGVAGVLLISAYSQWMFTVSWLHFGFLTSSALALALIVGRLKERARLADTLNGNINRLKEALDETRKLKLGWSDLSDAGRFKQVELIEHHLGNLAVLIFGWRAIGKEMDEAKRKAEVLRAQPVEVTEAGRLETLAGDVKHIKAMLEQMRLGDWQEPEIGRRKIEDMLPTYTEEEIEAGAKRGRILGEDE